MRLVLTLDRPVGVAALATDFYAWIITTPEGDESILLLDDNNRPATSTVREIAEQHRPKVREARLVKFVMTAP
jgi:hypothetical protein